MKKNERKESLSEREELEREHKKLLTADVDRLPPPLRLARLREILALDADLGIASY